MGSEVQAEEVEAGRPGAADRAGARIVAAVALGGVLGAPARHAVSLAVSVTPGTFPWGTFWTNVSGSFVVGALAVLILERFPSARYLRPFALSGFFGSFTTCSAFAVETDLLLRNGRVTTAVAYVAATIAAGLCAASAGMRLARCRRP